MIAEKLAEGDFSLTAGLLSTFSVINTITRWGSTEVQYVVGMNPIALVITFLYFSIAFGKVTLSTLNAYGRAGKGIAGLCATGI